MMAEFSTAMWVVLAGVGVVTMLLCLHTLASAVRNEIGMHDLRAEVVRRRNAYYVNLYSTKDESEDEIIEVGEAPEFETGERMAA
jgi:hypothetical protein